METTMTDPIVEQLERIDRAVWLSTAIRGMVDRLTDTERDIMAGIWRDCFIDAPEYQRLSRRRSYQNRAISRLVEALRRMATN